MQRKRGTASQKPDGYSLRTACKWLARFRDGGVAALADRVFAATSGGRSIRSDCRRPWIYDTSGCTLRRIASALCARLATFGRLMKGLGLGRLKKTLTPNLPFVATSGSGRAT
ncbi:leucine zipper domain-containing protein [Cyanobium sp. ULC082]